MIRNLITILALAWCVAARAAYDEKPGNWTATGTTGSDLVGTAAVNALVATNGASFASPALTSSPSTNGPAANELVTAEWARKNFGSTGSQLYNSTNVVGTAFDASTYLYVPGIQTTGSRTYASGVLTPNSYFGSVMTTNRYLQVNSPVMVGAYFTSEGGPANSAYKVHPEVYYCYDTNSSVLLGDYDTGGQTITHGAITNRYDWVISFPPIVSTNSTGFYLVRRFKVDTQVGTDSLKLTVGTNAVVIGTGSTISFTQPASAGANWVASGTTNSALVGTASLNALVATNSITLNGSTITSWPGGVTITFVSTNYPVLTTDRFVAALAAQTNTLPAAATFGKNNSLTVKAATTNGCDVWIQSGDTIDFSLTNEAIPFPVSRNYMSDGTNNWMRW